MIRPARASDAADIAACAKGAYAPYVPLMGREPAPMVADFDAQIAAGDVYVSTDDGGAFQGFVVFYRQGEHVMLENVAVLPSLAGKGVGRTLIAFCEETARRWGVMAVVLYTNEKMTDNLSIYPRLGYREIGRRTEHGFNRVYFEKRLD